MRIMAPDQKSFPIEYDPDLGHFYWTSDRGCRKRGSRCGYSHPRGYRHIEISGRLYQEHRLAIYCLTGMMPASVVDHINGDGCDNRAENLREATQSQNMANQKTRSDNALGIKGVRFHKAANKFHSEVVMNGTRYNLGCFETSEEAKKAYDAKLHSLFGPFARYE